MENIELFSARVCPFAHRSRLALMEKNLPFTLIEINLRNKPDWYFQLNPAGAVPALRQGDFILQESLIINEYVNECCTEPALLPSSAQQRAEARLWIDFSGSRFVPLFYRLLKAQRKEKQSAIAAELCKVLADLDNELKHRNGKGPYWFGWYVGLTDIAFYPWFERWAVLEHYRGLRIPDNLTSLLAWIETMQGRDAIKLGGEPADYYIGEYADYAARLK
ncbi:MAG: glutathione S-transferase family protein [Desulfuromusa sp.]|nr:glutathione S-transferase family protein [Desulfuromusa sp.]